MVRRRAPDSPLIRQKLNEAGVLVGTDARKNISEVNPGIDVQPLAGGREAGQDRSGAPAVIAPKKHPVFPSHCHSA